MFVELDEGIGWERRVSWVLLRFVDAEERHGVDAAFVQNRMRLVPPTLVLM